MFKMTPVILQNFFSRRATRRYPAVVRPPFAHARGAIRNDIATCSFCGICAIKCPSRCIAVDKKAAEWRYHPFACIYCGICVESCKTGSLHQEPLYRPAVTAREHIVLHGVVVSKDKQQGVAVKTDGQIL